MSSRLMVKWTPQMQGMNHLTRIFHELPAELRVSHRPLRTCPQRPEAQDQEDYKENAQNIKIAGNELVYEWTEEEKKPCHQEKPGAATQNGCDNKAPKVKEKGTGTNGKHFIRYGGESRNRHSPHVPPLEVALHQMYPFGSHPPLQ